MNQPAIQVVPFQSAASEADATAEEPPGGSSQEDINEAAEEEQAFPKALSRDSEGYSVIVPSGTIKIRDTAIALGKLLADENDLFTRWRMVAEICEDKDGNGVQIVPLKADACRPRFEKHCRFLRMNRNRNGEWMIGPGKLAMEDCRSIIASRELHAALPPISLVASSPIITEDKIGSLCVLSQRYNREAGGVAVMNPLAIDQGLDPHDAAADLLAILDDFDFASGGDLARAFVALITPALKFGGLLSVPTPMDVGEADDSQSGKTYRQKVVRAIDGEDAGYVFKRAGGVGSLDESLGQKLFGGSPFIALENTRGRLDSQMLEAVITAGSDLVPVRIPYQGEVPVDASRVIFQMTSNAAEMTRDLANRSVICRIRKRPDGYPFRRYPEGDLLAHVEAKQARYLSCVFTLIREWHQARKPQGDTAHHHDFRDWYAIMQWFATFAGLGDLMEDHAEAKARAANPAVAWLRVVALNIVKRGNADREYSASELADIGDEEGHDVPGFRGGEDKVRNQAAGRALAKAYAGAATTTEDNAEISEITIGEIRITREVRDEYLPDLGSAKEIKRYRFTQMLG